MHFHDPDEAYVLKIPDGMDMAGAAPLLCAGEEQISPQLDRFPSLRQRELLGSRLPVFCTSHAHQLMLFQAPWMTPQLGVPTHPSEPSSTKLRRRPGIHFT